jgi:hypothetical protein
MEPTVEPTTEPTVEAAEPIMVTLNAVQDTWLSKPDKSTNYGSNTTFSVEGEETRVKRAGLRFDLSGIPAGATVSRAVLTLAKVGGDSASDIIAVHALTQAWTETGASWETYDGSGAWNSAGGAYSPTPAARQTVAGNSSYSWEMTGLVQNWISGTQPNFGLLLKQDPEQTGNQPLHDFSSREGATPPTLIITYQVTD